MYSLQAKLAFERLDIPKEYHPFILGANSSVVKSICESTGARVNIPPMSLNKDEITIAGEKDAVAKALVQIRKLYSELVGSHKLCMAEQAIAEWHCFNKATPLHFIS